MSKPQLPQVTFTAHQTHWYDIFQIIMQAVQAANPIVATILPAPVEAGIQIAVAEAPIVVATGQAIAQTSSASAN
jgi:hypothetical protein